MAVAALGKLTKLVFKKPHRIFFTTSWLKEFNRVVFSGQTQFRHSTSCHFVLYSLGSLIMLTLE